MNRVLLLGASGFIGKYLAARLRQRGCHVVGYGRSASSEEYPVISGDFSREDRFATILRDERIDTVYHLISTTVPQEETSGIPKEITDNVVPTVRLLEGMKEAGTKRLVFASSGGTVYGDSAAAHMPAEPLCPQCGYGVQKAVIEMYMQFYARRYGLDCRIARISNPYGVPPQKNRRQGIIPIFMRCLLEGEPIVMYGDTVRDYIHVDDVTEALIRFGEYEGASRVLNIGTGSPVSTSEIVRMIEKTAGREFTYIERQPIRECDVERNTLDISETVDALCWRPSISLQEGIARTWREISDVGA